MKKQKRHIGDIFMVTANEFNSALNQIKDQHGISMTQIAQDIGVPRSMLDNMRRGSQKIKKEVVDRIIKAHPAFGDYLKGAPPPANEPEVLDMREISAKFEEYKNEIMELRLIVERQLRLSAEREVEFMKKLLEQSKDRD